MSVRTVGTTVGQGVHSERVYDYLE